MAASDSRGHESTLVVAPRECAVWMRAKGQASYVCRGARTIHKSMIDENRKNMGAPLPRNTTHREARASTGSAHADKMVCTRLWVADNGHRLTTHVTQIHACGDARATAHSERVSPLVFHSGGVRTAPRTRSLGGINDQSLGASDLCPPSPQPRSRPHGASSMERERVRLARLLLVDVGHHASRRQAGRPWRRGANPARLPSSRVLLSAGFR